MNIWLKPSRCRVTLRQSGRARRKSSALARALSRVLSRAVVRRDPDTALREITLQDIHRAGCLGKRHVAVGPDQIERVLCKTGLAVLRAPGEFVQRQPLLPAP